MVIKLTKKNPIAKNLFLKNINQKLSSPKKVRGVLKERKLI